MSRLRLLRIVSLAVGIFAVSSCATIESLLEVERPVTRVESVRLVGLSFTGADLVADLQIENPNRIAVTLSGFDYTVAIEGRTLLTGTSREALAIAAFATSRVSVPFSVAYDGVVALVERALEQDDLAYELAVTFAFDVPVLGTVSVPLSYQGTIPVVRPPAIRVASLAIGAIGINGADLTLGLRIENPNRFAVALAFDQSFVVGGQTWVDGSVERVTIPARATADIPVPFRLSFTAFGRTVRELLLGADSVSFTYSGDLFVEPDIRLVPRTRLPFALSGSVPLSRR